jgi:hypothetical protein
MRGEDAQSKLSGLAAAPPLAGAASHQEGWCRTSGSVGVPLVVDAAEVLAWRRKESGLFDHGGSGGGQAGSQPSGGSGGAGGHGGAAVGGAAGASAAPGTGGDAGASGGSGGDAGSGGTGATAGGSGAETGGTAGSNGGTGGSGATGGAPPTCESVFGGISGVNAVCADPPASLCKLAFSPNVQSCSNICEAGGGTCDSVRDNFGTCGTSFSSTSCENSSWNSAICFCTHP